MPAYSVHLHDGGTVPPRSTHMDAPDDLAAKDWALKWLDEYPAYTHVSVVEGMRLVGKYPRGIIPAPSGSSASSTPSPQ